MASVYVPPPPGWETYGTLIDAEEDLEFSEETDEDGLPLWERVARPKKPLGRLYRFDNS